MIIKKYKNRKYYCLDKKKFVGEDFILRCIKNKIDIMIMDHKDNIITIPIILKLFRKVLRNEKARGREKEKVF